MTESQALEEEEEMQGKMGSEEEDGKTERGTRMCQLKRKN